MEKKERPAEKPASTQSASDLAGETKINPDSVTTNTTKTETTVESRTVETSKEDKSADGKSKKPKSKRGIRWDREADGDSNLVKLGLPTKTRVPVSVAFVHPAWLKFLTKFLYYVGGPATIFWILSIGFLGGVMVCLALGVGFVSYYSPIPRQAASRPPVTTTVPQPAVQPAVPTPAPASTTATAANSEIASAIKEIGQNLQLIGLNAVEELQKTRNVIQAQEMIQGPPAVARSATPAPAVQTPSPPEPEERSKLKDRIRREFNLKE